MSDEEKKHTILVVDDEESVRLLYKEELEEEGYSVITAEDGEEAIKKVSLHRPDLITLDIRMPGMDGIEVLHRIREMDKDIPVIMSTAYGEYRHDFNIWASDAYVIKTANLEELKRNIRRLLGDDAP
ncbi:MAG: response regulator [Proteobacteria bacterium]|nr:response regulator [Pseudomonadota bacterium]